MSPQRWSNIDRKWLFTRCGKNCFDSLLLLRLTHVTQIYVLPEEVRLFRNHLERSLYSGRALKSGAQDFMPADNSRQRLPYPVTIKLSFNQKTGHDAKRLTWKRLLRNPNLSLLRRKPEAVGGYALH
jgi:hypothetical protein